jgi:hypothetical protein
MSNKGDSRDAGLRIIWKERNIKRRLTIVEMRTTGGVRVASCELIFDGVKKMGKK